MSNFQESGKSEGLTGAEAEAAEVPDWFVRYLRGALKLPLFAVPKPFETWMIDKVATSGFDVPIGQIIGFAQFTAQSNTVSAQETTTSGTLGDLATVGPRITGLSAGSYLVLWGTAARNTTVGARADMHMFANGSSIGATRVGGSQEIITVGTFRTVTFTGTNNELCAKYGRAGPPSTAEFEDRVLSVFRYANA